MGARTITVMWWQESLFLGLVPFQLFYPIFGGNVVKVPLGIFKGGTTNYVTLSPLLCIRKCPFRITERWALFNIKELCKSYW